MPEGFSKGVVPRGRQWSDHESDTGFRTAALSIARGNGKTTLAALVGKRFLEAGSGETAYLISGSLGQAKRTLYRALEAQLGASEYKFTSSINACGVRCRRTGTALELIAARAKQAMGFLHTPLVLCDEPGAWQTNDGQLMADAIQTAMGKPGSRLKALYVGTIAPSVDGWWADLCRSGPGGSKHVELIQGDLDTWDKWSTVKAANPLMSKFAESREVLREELREARRDPRLKARFLSYRLNIPSRDESEVLLTVADWKAVMNRRVAEPKGKPIFGVDLGSGLSWSACVAFWPESRLIDAVAVAPGIPDVEAMEKRDQVASTSYLQLVEEGTLELAHGSRVPPPSQLVGKAENAFGTPDVVICDRWREAELRDAAPHWRIEPRVSRWSEASEDIRALRKFALDSGLTVTESARGLLTASLAVALVKNDDQGNCRLTKTDNHKKGRDDVAAALVLAAGEADRRLRVPAFEYTPAEFA